MGRIAVIQSGKIAKRGKAKATTAPGSKVDKRHQIGASDWVNSGKWVRVKSSNVAGISYHRKKHALSVEFIGGAVYLYRDVAVNVAREMFNASSVGKFVHRRLKGKYAYARIR